MYPKKLHTRQYADGGLTRLLRVKRTKATGPHAIRVMTTMATVGLGAWCGSGIGSGIAQADDNHEQEACALMNDYGTAIHLAHGESTEQYAFAVHSTEMPPAEAAHVLVAATRDDCPNHAADLPPGWL